MQSHRYPYGGATTTYEALLLGTPVVSTPGPALRGRFTRALLARMGFHDWLVPLQRLAGAALSVGRAAAAAGAAARREHRAHVAERAAEALEDADSLHEWSRFLVRSVQAAHRAVADGGAGDAPCDEASIAACGAALTSERPVILVVEPDDSSRKPLQRSEDGGVVITVLVAGATVGRTAESCVAIDGGPGACINGSVAPYDAPGYSPALTAVPDADDRHAVTCLGVGPAGSDAAQLCADTWTAFVPGACGTARRLWSARFVANELPAGRHVLRVWLQTHGRVVAEAERSFNVPSRVDANAQ